MSTSLSFDRAAGYYDQTRNLSEAMATRGLQIILDRAGPSGSILEVGAGTGRIGVPLWQHGANWFGCDLSIEMMRRLREKYPAARIVQSDASRLPYVSNRFDVAVTIHVLHLVGPWRAALREIKRVLQPGGVYINGGSGQREESVSQKMQDYWRGRIEAHGADWRRPGVQDREELLAELKQLGAQLEEIEIDRGSYLWKPGEALDILAQRTHSGTWNIPDAIFDAALRETRIWAEQEFGDLDRGYPQEYYESLDVIRF
jgi:ubiquinone/menaquinone biosynthesis C-methylase UbiE